MADDLFSEISLEEHHYSLSQNIANDVEAAIITLILLALMLSLLSNLNKRIKQIGSLSLNNKEKIKNEL